MKIIHNPRVCLVGRQEVDDAALAGFLAGHGVESWSTDTDVAGQVLVEVAGRLCYMSYAAPRPGGNGAYVDHLLAVGHGSVLEHAVFNLIIAGVSRSFTHELVRHRAGFSYSQLSQRYVDESDCEFVVPPLVQELAEHDERLGREWQHAMRSAANSYRFISDRLMHHLALRHASAHAPNDTFDGDAYIRRLPAETRTAMRKQAREAARSVLPNATETKVFVTANARALRHFVELRAHPAADAEMRRVALAVLAVLQREAPALFGDYTLVNGSASTLTRKV